MKVIKLNRAKRTGYKGKSDPYYQSKAWKLLKGAAESQLSHLCPMCQDEGVTKEGDVWDHIEQRKLGGVDDLKNLRKLCFHHDAVNRAIQSKAARAIK